MTVRIDSNTLESTYNDSFEFTSLTDQLFDFFGIEVIEPYPKDGQLISNEFDKQYLHGDGVVVSIQFTKCSDNVTHSNSNTTIGQHHDDKTLIIFKVSGMRKPPILHTNYIGCTGTWPSSAIINSERASRIKNRVSTFPITIKNRVDSIYPITGYVEKFHKDPNLLIVKSISNIIETIDKTKFTPTLESQYRDHPNKFVGKIDLTNQQVHIIYEPTAYDNMIWGNEYYYQWIGHLDRWKDHPHPVTSYSRTPDREWTLPERIKKSAQRIKTSSSPADI